MKLTPVTLLQNLETLKVFWDYRTESFYDITVTFLASDL